VAALVVGTLLALGATGTLVLTDNPEVLRLAIVVALWAFVLATMAGVRRQPAGDGDGLASREIELRRSYEIELERETAARREFELRVGLDLRRELEDGVRQYVDTLRDEVFALRQDVVERLDGELRVERVAWHGESTRLTGGGTPALRGFADGPVRYPTGSVPAISGEPADRDSHSSPAGPDHHELDVPPPPAMPVPVTPIRPVPPPIRTEMPPVRPEVPPIRGEVPPPPVQPDPLHDPLPPDALQTAVPFGQTRFGSDTGEFEVSSHHALPPSGYDPFAPAAATYRPDRAEPAGQRGGGRHAQPTPASHAAPEPDQPRHRRYRDEGEENDVLSRVLRER